MAGQEDVPVLDVGAADQPADGDPPAGVAPDRREAVAPIMPISLPYIPGAKWLPQYSGRPDTLSAFKRKICGVLDMYAMTGKQRAAVVLGQLTGAAEREIDTWSPEEQESVNDIFAKLKAAFEDHNEIDLRMRFYHCSQGPEDTIRDFAWRLQDALRALKQINSASVIEENKMLTEQFIRGLRSKEESRTVRWWALDHPDADFATLRDMAIKGLRAPYSPDSVVAQKTDTEPPVLPPPAASLAITTNVQTAAPDRLDTLTAEVQRLSNHLAWVIETLQLQTEPESAGKILLAESPEDVPWMRRKRRTPPSSMRTPPSSARTPPSSVRTPPSSGRSQAGRSPTGAPFCRRCNKEGHTIASCPLNKPRLSVRAITRE